MNKIQDFQDMEKIIFNEYNNAHETEIFRWFASYKSKGADDAEAAIGDSGLIHKHLLMRVNFAKYDITLEDKELFESFMDYLIVEVLGMKIALPTRAVLVEDQENYGLTGSGNLTTSHLSFHVWSQVEEPFMTFDVYSCKCFDEAKVFQALEAQFPQLINSIEYTIIDRVSKYENIR